MRAHLVPGKAKEGAFQSGFRWMGMVQLFRLRLRNRLSCSQEGHKMLWQWPGIRLMQPTAAAGGADPRRPSGQTREMACELYITCIIRA